MCKKERERRYVCLYICKKEREIEKYSRRKTEREMGRAGEKKWERDKELEEDVVPKYQKLGRKSFIES